MGAEAKNIHVLFYSDISTGSPRPLLGKPAANRRTAAPSLGLHLQGPADGRQHWKDVKSATPLLCKHVNEQGKASMRTPWFGNLTVKFWWRPSIDHLFTALALTFLPLSSLPMKLILGELNARGQGLIREGPFVFFTSQLQQNAASPVFTSVTIKRAHMVQVLPLRPWKEP